jgi:F-type H+-transporting ATPase subunit a
MHLSPDQIIYWQLGIFKLNATIVTTWALMLVLTVAAMLMTRRLSTGLEISRWQNFLEIIVGGIRDQIGEVGLPRPERFVGFIGTLFVFIAAANLCTILPWYEPPTGSLSTTAALALATFLAVPFYGIAERGISAYLKGYFEPTFLMLPFNIIGELSRTLALAVRLFGNIMSGTMILAILMSVVPLFFPILMTALGLLTGLVQAYIFGVLATVYVAAAVRGGEESISAINTSKASHG